MNMPSYVICPDCRNSVPTKYKKRKERKELIDPICKDCTFKKARKKYEEGVKKGIWMKKFDRARKKLSEATVEFQKANNNFAASIANIMEIMCAICLEPPVTEILNYFQKLLTPTFQDTFQGKGFIVPEFYDFDQITLEAKAFMNLFSTKQVTNEEEKVKFLQSASRFFFNIGHRQLYFSRVLTGSDRLNTEMALDSLAESEELLAEKAARTDINEASFHFEVAISSYTNLEDYQKAKELRNRRTAIRMERTCWICGARAHGYVTSFRYVYARSDPSYFELYKNLLTKRQEFIPHLHTDTIYTTERDNYIEVVDSVDVQNNFLEENAQGVYLAICKACHNVVDELSDVMAEKRIAPVRAAVGELKSRVQSIEQAIVDINQKMVIINQRINELFGLSHKH